MPANNPRNEPNDRESVATALGTANDAVVALQGIGEGAQALLEESGLWESIANWIKENPNVVTAGTAPGSGKSLRIKSSMS
ncbi:MAG TPA: hypothetical protein PLO61_10585 [Fimbriimonadaceae bacterium]|nr:hypothetical protein [Fimbriimonadaceae bacterium]HRJ34268.1 hypothetical protein [Fimbriimonadaceae bacterium]